MHTIIKINIIVLFVAIIYYSGVIMGAKWQREYNQDVDNKFMNQLTKGEK
jgi:hypothetical protein